jgi:RNase P subunit RPR2
MPTPRTVVRTGICDACGARLTHVLNLESGDPRNRGNNLEFRCPKCGQAGRIAAKATERLVGLQTKLSGSPLE